MGDNDDGSLKRLTWGNPSTIFILSDGSGGGYTLPGSFPRGTDSAETPFSALEESEGRVGMLPRRAGAGMDGL